MTTIATIAQELDLQPYELKAFLGLDSSFDLTEEVSEHDCATILELVEYDREHNTKPESYED